MHHSLTGRQDSPSQQPHYHGAPAAHIMKTLVKFLLLFPVLAFSDEEDKPTPLPVAELDRTQPVDFAKEVFPFVKKNCIPCHNTSKDKAKLNMETPELMMKGSENGPVIIKGNGAESYLFIVSAHHDEPTMPPTKNKAGAVQLTPEELALLKRWIDEGAKGLAPSQIEREIAWQPLATNLQSIHAAAISHDGTLAAAARANRGVMYNLLTGTAEGQLEAHQDIIQAMTFNRHDLLATAGYEKVLLWKFHPFTRTVDEVKAEPESKMNPAENGDELAKKYAANPSLIFHQKRLESEQRNATNLKNHFSNLRDEFRKKAEEENKKAREAAVNAVNAHAEKVKKETELSTARARQANADPAGKKAADDAFNKIEKETTEIRAKARSAKFNREAAIRISQRAAETLIQTEADLATAETRLTLLTTELEAANKAIAEYKCQPRFVLTNLVDKQTLVLDKTGEISTWTEGNQPIRRFQLRSAEPAWVHVTTNQQLVVGFTDKKVMQYDFTPRWEIVRTISNLTDRVTALDFSPDGLFLATGGGIPSRSGRLDIWNVETGEKAMEIAEAHTDNITSVAFSPDGEQIATGSPDRKIKIWKASDGSLVQTLEGHTDYVLDVAWRVDGIELASAGADKTVKRWQLPEGKQIETRKDYKKEVTAVDYLGYAGNIVSASGDKSVRIDNNRLSDVQSFVYIATTSSDGGYIAAGDHEGILRVWNARDKKLVHAFGP